jgi:hypothetical protein
MKSSLKIILTIGLFAASAFSHGACMLDGQSDQTVRLATDGLSELRWKPAKGEIHPVTLPNGFKLGLRIEPATVEKYREWIERAGGKGVDESVRIELFDLSAAEPKLLSNTWGGANSRQGFGPKGGANGVPALSQQITLWLHKPVCITAERLASMQ